ncbi:hypothetical protein L1887_15875 [Cichorium endivia]|nr:hypothetical protein L1887_15875 [Cichorium endivia]
MHHPVATGFASAKHGENSWKESVCLVLISVYKAKNTNIYLGKKIIIFCEREFGSCSDSILFFPFSICVFYF